MNDNNSSPSMSDFLGAFFLSMLLVGLPFIIITINEELDWRAKRDLYLKHQTDLVLQEEAERLNAIPVLVETVWSTNNFRVYQVGKQITVADILNFAVQNKKTISSPQEWSQFVTISAAGTSVWPLYRPGRSHLAYENGMLCLEPERKSWKVFDGWEVGPGTFILLKKIS